MSKQQTLCTTKPRVRLDYLDGLRGIMAINVVLNHFIVVFFPGIFYTSNGINLFNSTPIQAAYNGAVAVSYFFTLSGFLTAYFMLQKTKITIKDVVNKSIKRYFRLLPIVVFTVMLTYILMEFNLLYHLKIDRELLTLYCNFQPTFLSALKDAFIDTFLTSSDYVGPFWFVRFDFFGYIITLTTLYAIKKIPAFYPYRRIFMIACVFVYSYVSVQLTAFSLGILLADVYIGDETILSRHYNLRNKWIVWISGIIGVYLITIPTTFVGIWKPLETISLFKHTRFWCGLGWALCLWFLFNSERLKKFLTSKVFLFLGKISFPIYAVHWVCMLSLQDFLFFHFSRTMDYTVAAILSFVIVLPIIIVFAYFVWWMLEKNKPIERISKLLTKKAE